jgi:hypothetical protein
MVIPTNSVSSTRYGRRHLREAKGSVRAMPLNTSYPPHNFANTIGQPSLETMIGCVPVAPAVVPPGGSGMATLAVPRTLICACALPAADRACRAVQSRADGVARPGGAGAPAPPGEKRPGAFPPFPAFPRRPQGCDRPPQSLACPPPPALSRPPHWSLSAHHDQRHPKNRRGGFFWAALVPGLGAPAGGPGRARCPVGRARLHCGHAL